MIHILKDVYLNYKCNMTMRNDCIQIVDESIDEMYYDPEVAKLLEGNVSQLIYRTKTVDELMSLFPSDDIFFDKLLKFKSSNHRDELIIYCDKNSFKVFLSKWLKTLMPNADYETFKIVFNTYRNHELHITRNINQITDLRLKVPDYWPNSDEEIQELFELEPFNITTENYKKHASIEFQIATFLNNNGCSIAMDFANKISALGERRVILDMYYSKTEMEYYMYDLDLIWPEIGHIDHSTLNVKEVLDQKPGLKAVGNLSFRQLKSIKNLEENYDVPALSQACHDFAEFTHGLNDIVCLRQFIENNYAPVNPLKIIDTDLRYKGTYRTPPYMGYWVELKRMNGHFVSYLADLYVQNNPLLFNKLSMDKNESVN
jgi:hypothetical protein